MSVNEMPRRLTWEEIEIGTEASFSVDVSAEKVKSFIAVSGDQNPLHQDAAFARARGFVDPLAHGMLLGSFFSALVGTYLPGLYTTYLGQELQFRNPVYIGEQVTVRGRVKEKIDAVKTLVLETTIEKSDGTIAVKGIARVLYKK
jgi:acyl dehydratase